MTALGPFPAFLQKTDAERVQNLDGETWEGFRRMPRLGDRPRRWTAVR